MAVIGINYNEGGNPLDYKSVYIHLRDKDKELLFDTGDFVKDWYDALKAFITSIPESLAHSSTCDHFITDGAEYDSAYLHMVEDKPVLKYLDRSQEDWIDNQMDVYENGVEFFVEPGTQPTWEEFKEKYDGKRV